MALALPTNQKVPETTTCYLGIDPGLRKTGYVILERNGKKPILREGGIIRSDSQKSLAQRVREIGHGLQEVIAEFSPQAAAIEQIFSLGKNPKSALLLAHARGAILMSLAEYDIPVVHFSATQVKKTLTGNGRANKEQMQFAVMNELGLDEILEPHDVADATAIALCLYHSVKFTL